MSESDKDLTLEKLKVEERLRGVENQLAVLTLAVTDLKEAKSIIHSDFNERILANTILLIGQNGRPGLIVRVDRLEQRFIHIGILYGAFITALIAEVLHWVFKF